jgi:hypothetical protein
MSPLAMFKDGEGREGFSYQRKSKHSEIDLDRFHLGKLLLVYFDPAYSKLGLTR